MRWQGGRQSENVEDRRGMRGPVMVGGGLTTLLLLVLGLVFGIDLRPLLQQGQNMPQGPNAAPAGPLDPGGLPGPESAGLNDEQKEFVATVLADTEDVWREQFRKMGETYREPKLVLFSGGTRSACGQADSAVGPFYCPLDQQVYLDTQFFIDLEQRFRAPGEFARAYVIAHEVGHHVQHLMGWSDQVQAAQRRFDKRAANRLSVRLELQADFLAGVWAHHAHRSRQILERGDIESALDAATAIGDDRLQREATGHVVPDSFTHGTSAQRARWFRRGLETGDFGAAVQLFKINESEL